VSSISQAPPSATHHECYCAVIIINCDITAASLNTGAAEVGAVGLNALIYLTGVSVHKRSVHVAKTAFPPIPLRAQAAVELACTCDQVQGISGELIRNLKEGAGVKWHVCLLRDKNVCFLDLIFRDPANREASCDIGL